MTDEDLIDCILEVDRLLEELESALQSKKFKLATDKLMEARAAIEDLKEEHCAEDTKEIEMNIMRKLK